MHYDNMNNPSYCQGESKHRSVTVSAIMGLGERERERDS